VSVGNESMIVYTGGTFDLFHSGHVNFLKRCKEIAGHNGKVVVSLNTDDFILKYKESLPVCSEQERKIVLESCKYVDEVIFNVGGKDSKIAIDLVKPNYIIIGSDWARKDYYEQMQFTQDWLDDKSIGLIYIPYTSGISTTRIKEKLL
jgi:glycerol-3-phosphate cytidylyltransferase